VLIDPWPTRFKRSDRRLVLLDISPVSSTPFHQAVLGEIRPLRISTERPPGKRQLLSAGRSMETFASWAQRETVRVHSGDTTIGSSEFFSEFCLKMSAKEC
jgi:hypothetical protein